MNKYNISGNAYSVSMNEKTTQYNNLIRKAEMLNRDHNGVPTKEEGELYLEASKVCAEIMNLNLSQRAVYAQWKQRKADCEEEVKRIVDFLAPQPVVPPAQQDLYQEPAAPTAVNRRPAAEQAAVQSKSGFSTKNAVKDVTAETIQRWYKEKPRHGFADVAGMDNLKKMLEDQVSALGWDCIDDVLHISPVQSYFFYGPPGSGKTYVIEAFAKEMMDKGFKFIRLLGGDIHQSLVGVAEKIVQIAFQEAIDNEPCIIFVDEIENVCVSRSSPKVEGHERRLTVAFLEAYNLLKESQKRVIFVGATNYPGQVDEAMLDRITMVRIPLPPIETRELYFSQKLGTLSQEDGFTFWNMAELTENYSFRDLERLVDTLKVRIKSLAIDFARVEKEDGTLDQEQTDLAGQEAIVNGEIRLTRELFVQTQGEVPPSDKAKIQAELDEFESRVRGRLPSLGG